MVGASGASNQRGGGVLVADLLVSSYTVADFWIRKGAPIAIKVVVVVVINKSLSIRNRTTFVTIFHRDPYVVSDFELFCN